MVVDLLRLNLDRLIEIVIVVVLQAAAIMCIGMGTFHDPLGSCTLFWYVPVILIKGHEERVSVTMQGYISSTFSEPGKRY